MTGYDHVSLADNLLSTLQQGLHIPNQTSVLSWDEIVSVVVEEQVSWNVLFGLVSNVPGLLSAYLQSPQFHIW